jgi:purine nucleosidase
VFPALLVLIAMAATACRQRRTVVMDHDGAIDDYVALVMLLNSPDRRLQGVTISFGNSYPEAAVETTRRILLSYGQQPRVGVYRPEQRGRNEFPPAWRKASAAVSGLAGLEPAGRETARDAATMLRHLLDRGGLHSLDVLVTGPLTNIAAVLQPRENMLQRIRRMVVMGGAVRVPGNAPGGRAEYNMFIDPEAADYVFSLTRRGLRVELIALDATNYLPVKAPFLEKLRAQQTRSARQAAEILSLAGPSLEQPGYYLWDAAAALALLRPETFVFSELRLHVLPDGRTVESPEGHGPVHVALGITPGSDPLEEVIAILGQVDR